MQINHFIGTELSPIAANKYSLFIKFSVSSVYYTTETLQIKFKIELL